MDRANLRGGKSKANRALGSLDGVEGEMRAVIEVSWGWARRAGSERKGLAKGRETV